MISWRRLERDLHDAVQQRLIALRLKLRGLGAMMPADLPRLRARITEIGDGLIRVLDELREIARGLHPTILTGGGLDLALKALAGRSAVSATLTVQIERRPPEPVEMAGVLHGVRGADERRQRRADVSCASDTYAADRYERISIRDGGVGVAGLDLERGSGLDRTVPQRPDPSVLIKCQGRQPVMNTIDQTSAENAESPNISCARVGYAIRPTVWASVERS
ncbi:sensor histidine kinase [Nocardia gipuzkoensis]